MAISISSNSSSLKARRNLASASDALGRASERLSSGQRINRASDDAAGLSVAMSLRSKTRVAAQGVRNINDSLSLLNIAQGAYGTLGSILERQIELATQSANGSLSDAQRNSLQEEYSALQLEYSRVIQTTRFNGLNIFGSLGGRLNVQADGSATQLNIQGGSETLSLQGAGTFSTGSRSLSYTNGEFIVLDFNNDGRDDIIAVSADDAGITIAPLEVYRGNADGTFTLTDLETNILDYGSASSGINNIRLWHAGGTSYGLIVTRNDLSTVGVYFDVNGSGTVGFSGLASGASPDDGVTSANLDINGDGFSDYASLTGGTLSFGVQNTHEVFGFVPDDLDQTASSIAVATAAREALDVLQQNRITLSSSSSVLGASFSRLEAALGVVQTSLLESRAAYERITSSDVALESAQYAAQQIRLNVTSAILAQANTQPNIALRLLSL